MISISVLSPTASSFFLSGAFVHPHPGLTSVIRSVSSPTLLTQNTCEILEFCGTYPKLNVVCGTSIFAFLIGAAFAVSVAPAGGAAFVLSAAPNAGALTPARRAATSDHSFNRIPLPWLRSMSTSQLGYYTLLTGFRNCKHHRFRPDFPRQFPTPAGLLPSSPKGLSCSMSRG